MYTKPSATDHACTKDALLSRHYADGGLISGGTEAARRAPRVHMDSAAYLLAAFR